LIIFVLVLALAAGVLAWVLLEHPKIQYGAMKAPRALASALSSIAGGEGRTTSASKPQSAEHLRDDASAELPSQQREEDVEAMVRRHLYGRRSG
jgi:hypothetical protein